MPATLNYLAVSSASAIFLALVRSASSKRPSGYFLVLGYLFGSFPTRLLQRQLHLFVHSSVPLLVPTSLLLSQRLFPCGLFSPELRLFSA